MIPNFAEHAAANCESPDHQRPAAPGRTAGWRPFRGADRACCCSAKPVVVAIMPPATGREHATDLLLCGHHYRTSRQALSASGASVFDQRGSPVTPEEATAAAGAYLAFSPVPARPWLQGPGRRGA